jgi:hypothetical protein
MMDSRFAVVSRPHSARPIRFNPLFFRGVLAAEKTAAVTANPDQTPGAAVICKPDRLRPAEGVIFKSHLRSRFGVQKVSSLQRHGGDSLAPVVGRQIQANIVQYSQAMGLPEESHGA